MSEQILRELMVRLTRLEGEIQQIKDLVQREKEEVEKPWWEKISGSHKNDKIFAEIARLGAEIRRAEREATRKEATPKKRNHRSTVRPSGRE